MTQKVGSFEIVETQLPGCLELLPQVFRDSRGAFVKMFQAEWFASHGLWTEFTDEFYSVSNPGVLRGLHFQEPPWEQIKVVSCVSGRVLDVALDLRVGSPTYGRHHAYELDAEKANLAYLPAGIAHGYCVIGARPATVVYRASRTWSPPHDKGILWSSAGVRWPVETPELSARDRLHPTLAEYQSPFRF